MIYCVNAGGFSELAFGSIILAKSRSRGTHNESSDAASGFGVDIGGGFLATSSSAQGDEAEKIYQNVKQNILNITPEKCVSEMTRAIELDGSNPVYLSYRGYCYMLLNDDAKAFADYDKALKLNPAYIEALYGRSNLLAKTDKEKAIEDLKLIVAIDPKQTNAYGILAGIYLDLGKYDDAYAMGAKLVELIPEGGAGARYEAESLARRGHYQEAIPLYSVAIKRFSSDMESLRGRAAAYRHVGNIAGAEADEKTIKRLEQNSGGTGGGMGRGPGELRNPQLTNPAATDDETPPTPVDTAKIEPIKIIQRERPAYTKEARDAQIQGIVMLRITFNADGTIGAIVPIRGLPNGLTEQAVEAARKIKFQPATRDGVPITQTKVMEFTFSIY
jgi:TonB family protein